MTNVEVINYYLEKSKTKNYLEIRLGDDTIFNQINANIKNSVDPIKIDGTNFHMSSDEFFGAYAINLEYKYDVIFINSAHETEQADIDIYNSLKFLNEGGVIVVDGCNPQSKAAELVPASTDIFVARWCGNVWKSIFKFRKNNSHIMYDVFVIDYVGVIIPNRVGTYCNLEMPNSLNYDLLYFSRHDVLNTIGVDEFNLKELRNSKKPKIHFLTFATGTHRNSGYVFRETQKKLVDSIQSKTSYEVVFHTHDFNSMISQPWFYKIKDYPKLFIREWWKRDGYLCAYKAFFAKQLMDIIDDGDIIYYTDSSAYYKEGFSENIDRFIKYVEYNGHVCGATANDCKHNSFNCCDNKDIWNEVYKPAKLDFDYLLNKVHVLASWYAFQKNEENIKFVNEWVYWITYKLNDIPLARYHHTVDQSIFNMLVYKYGFKTFYNPDNIHELSKNHNLVHRQLAFEPNDDIENLKKWFKNPHDI
jgi:hypothetical protein